MSATEVTFGADFPLSVRAGPFRVSVATFPPNGSIASHFHEWSCVSVLLEGRFEQRFSGKLCECPPGVVLAKPPGERHEDRWFDESSRHLIVEIDPSRHDELGPSRRVAEEIMHVPDLGSEVLAHTAWRELSDADSLTPLAIHGLVLQLLARTHRVDDEQTRTTPGWLRTAREYVHDNYASSIRLAEVAEVVGVHPHHLSRVFSSSFRVPLGEYVRQLRVEAAAARLIASDESISAIAHSTGFSDQSHLTRAFKRRVGATPASYRSAYRRGTTS